jgi:hypothetical protein
VLLLNKPLHVKNLALSQINPNPTLDITVHDLCYHPLRGCGWTC